MAEGKGYYRGTADALVHQGACLLYSVVVLVSVTGGDVTIYDGQDTTSGRRVARVEGIADVNTVVDFQGVVLSRGLYVDVGSSVTEYTVVWKPLVAA